MCFAGLPHQIHLSEIISSSSIRHLVAAPPVTYFTSPSHSGSPHQHAFTNPRFFLNFSVLDGWWYEGYRFDEKAGWALTDKRTYTDQAQQDKLDAATIYSMLENEIIPLYFNKNYKGYSPEWIQYIKRSIGNIAPHFTMKRQLDDYISRFYQPEAKRAAKLEANNFARAREIVAWKEEVASKWDSIQVLSSNFDEVHAGASRTGDKIDINVVIDTKGLGDSVGVELVFYKEEHGESKYDGRADFKVVKRDGSIFTYELKSSLKEAGTYKYALRMYPKNEALPHRQDFAYVRWF